MDARARKARAEADERNAQAEQLEADAGRHQERAQSVRAERDDQLHRADELDPDAGSGDDAPADATRDGTGAEGRGSVEDDREGPSASGSRSTE